MMNSYTFTWEQLGNLKDGRPNLGKMTTVEIYRMMQYTMRTVLEHDLGADTAGRIFVEAGKLAGTAFCKQCLDTSLPLNNFMAQLDEKLLEHAIGILRVEKMDPENLNMVVTLSEDLDCSGLPVSGNTVCEYDEGFLAGIFNVYAGKEFEVKEIDCWATGERTCRFAIHLK